MAAIEKHIIDLLHAQDKLIIPDFGTFYVEEKPAEAHPVTHSFKPGQRIVTFGEKEKEGKEDLVSVVAFYENMPYEEAEKVVQGYVYDIRQKLKEHGSYNIKGLGKFKISGQYNLVFDFDQEADFNSYTFGLPTIDVQPAKKESGSSKEEKQKAKQEENKPKFKVPIWVYVLLPMMLVVGLVVFIVNNQKNKELAKTEPKAKTEQVEDSTKKENTAKEEPEEKKEAEKQEETTVNDTLTNKEANKTEQEATEKPAVDYMVVAASFRLEENAQEFEEMLRKKGFEDIKIMPPAPGKTLIKVTVGTFDSSREAIEHIAIWNEKHKQIGINKVKDWWVMEVPKEKEEN